jgi:hypothetical protein
VGGRGGGAEGATSRKNKKKIVGVIVQAQNLGRNKK